MLCECEVSSLFLLQASHARPVEGRVGSVTDSTVTDIFNVTIVSTLPAEKGQPGAGSGHI